MEAADRLFLDRAYELAERGTGNTSPNPPVGAVVVAGGAIVGEGYHHRAGEAHAEVHALSAAGERSGGATLYVSLEPCNHYGRTPPCTLAVTQAGIARVVIGTADPNPRTAGGGIAALRGSGIEVHVADEPRARALVEPFSYAVRSGRPYVTLKMALSLDGYVAPASARTEQLTSDAARAVVRDLRIGHDAVMVGAGTVRVDDPQLTVRPPHTRLREYVRVVACESDTIDADAAVLRAQEGYATTIVVAPSGLRERFRNLRGRAELLFVGSSSAQQLDFVESMAALRERGVASILCEGGPTMGGHLLAQRLVDRFVWLIAPRFLRTGSALSVLNAGDVHHAVRGAHIDRVETLGPDVLISGTLDYV